MRWDRFAAAAPDLAGFVGERLAGSRLLLGTVRRDGSPRISPVEPYLTDFRLLFGSMSWSHKAVDLRRDPRCVLHTPITSPDAGEPECRLFGRAIEASAALRDARRDAWWMGRPPELAAVFEMLVEEATWIERDLEEGVMTIRSWSPEPGTRTRQRPYP